MNLPKHVTVIEVGPRDGLQNEAETIPVEQKLAFIQALTQANLPFIEVTSFVHPQRIPQLADAMAVIQGLPQGADSIFSALVPNQRGLERAFESGIQRIAVFTAASETFTQKNINMSIKESLSTFRPVVEQALAKGLSVRGYLSTGFVCPYEGNIAPEKVLKVTQALFDLGVDEVSLGDTIGAAAPTDVYQTADLLIQTFPPEKLALHFHDTYGTALANVYAGLELGITRFDSSAGGLGGCPYAPGASGNLATEDLIYFLHRMGIETGVNLEQVAKASQGIQTYLQSKQPGRLLPSKQLQRLSALCASNR